MKFFSKIAAILAALMLACAFVACSNDGGSSDDESSVATFIGTSGDVNGITFSFSSNNKVTISGGGNSTVGTYTENPSATSGSGTVSYYDSGAGSSYTDNYSISGNTMTISGGWNGTLTRQ